MANKNRKTLGKYVHLRKYLEEKLGVDYYLSYRRFWVVYA